MLRRGGSAHDPGARLVVAHLVRARGGVVIGLVLAYWIGSQANAVVSTRSAMVGSVGAYVSVVDYHRMLANAGIEVKVFRNKEGTFKAAGMPGTAVAQDHATEFSRQAHRSFELFRSDESPYENWAGRGVDLAPVGLRQRERASHPCLGDRDLARGPPRA